ncbi:MAG: N-acetyl-gamma-glutamyl-phosphate reductase [Proteobacteria bacterium]|nr:N-acetyl-gamma-glutamyl-phosphate reductase [Pseudomonadota bacterium]
MSDKIQAVVIGATGYVGGELLRLISMHPDLQLAAAISESRAGDRIAACFPHLSAVCGEMTFVSHTEWLAAIAPGSRLAMFSAAPHGASAGAIKVALEAAEKAGMDVHVVDSSADFRFSNLRDFESIYGIKHGAPELMARFQCGVPEHVTTINTPHIAHPGCFATAILLASVPLLGSATTDGELFVTGITGSTGSGKRPQPGTHHPERHSNLYAYKPLTHRHTAEIVRLAKTASGKEASINFVPHSGPYARGIYVSVQAKLNRETSQAELQQFFLDAYADAPFVEIVSEMPKLKDVVASNYCHIGIATSGDTVVVTSAIDNLVKGAAGGAMQWMNRLWDLPETTGLGAPAPAWT